MIPELTVAANQPKDFVAIDFETFYHKKTYDINLMGDHGYVTDERFDPYLVAINDGVNEFVGHPKDFDWSCLVGRRWLSHNAKFDAMVFIGCQNKGYIDKSIQPGEWSCTLNMSAYFSGHRNLKDAARVLLGEEVDKEIRDELNGKHWDDIVLSGMEAQVKEYALRDARLCYRLWQTYGSRWPEWEQKLSSLTIQHGLYGVYVDYPKLVEAINVLYKVRDRATSKLPWVDGTWDDCDTVPLSPKALELECAKVGIKPPGSLAETSEECEEWEDTYGSKYPWVAAMRDARRSNIFLRKLLVMKSRTRATDGRMGYDLKYFGAGPGRWAGGSKYNIQNLKKDPLYINADYDVVGEKDNYVHRIDMRALIIPTPGKKFAIVDLSQIEPRCLAWVVDDRETLNKVREGFGIYEAHARATMGWSAGKLKDEDKKLYALAKARVLGLGYGCAAAKFVKVAKNMAGLDISLLESKKNVADFRMSNQKITTFWKTLERQARACLGGDFKMTLPSGRTMHYRGMHMEPGNWGPSLNAEIGGRNRFLYGGKLTENLIQAIARDVFAHNMLLLHDAGYKIMFHVHDEVIVELEEGQSLDDVIRIMSTCPSWLEGCPIAAEGNLSDCYLK